MRFKANDIFECDADTYWTKLFFDEEYGRRLYLEGLGFKRYELLEVTGEPGQKRTRRIFVEPQSDAPAVVTKLIGGNITYTEDGTYDPSTGIWNYAAKTSKMADKIKIGGNLWVEPAGDKRIKRISDVEISVSIFGVGGVVEGFIEKTTRESLSKTAAFTNRFIKEKGY